MRTDKSRTKSGAIKETKIGSLLPCCFVPRRRNDKYLYPPHTLTSLQSANLVTGRVEPIDSGDCATHRSGFRVRHARAPELFSSASRVRAVTDSRCKANFSAVHALSFPSYQCRRRGCLDGLPATPREFHEQLTHPRADPGARRSRSLPLRVPTMLAACEEAAKFQVERARSREKCHTG